MAKNGKSPLSANSSVMAMVCRPRGVERRARIAWMSSSRSRNGSGVRSGSLRRRVPLSYIEQPPPQVKRSSLPSTTVVMRSIRQRLPAPPHPCVERQTKTSFFATSASRKRRASSGFAASRSSSLIASSAMPSAPTVPGFGGTTTAAPVWRTTAAASASDENGMPWQKTTCPTERLPLTRFR